MPPPGKSSCRKLSFKRKCFHKDCFEHFGSLAQGLGPNSIQHLIPDTISTHIQGPKMLKLGCLSQPLRISTASLLKGTFSRNVSNRTLSHILFESEYFLSHCLADGHFLTYYLCCRMIWLKVIFSCIIWFQGTSFHLSRIKIRRMPTTTL